MHRDLRAADGGATALVVLHRGRDQQGICGAISAAGWHVVVAANGEAAVAQARLTLPRLVVVDANLPRLRDGRHPAQVLGRLRDGGERAELVLVATRNDAYVAGLASVAGAKRILLATDGTVTGYGDAHARHAPETIPGPEVWIVDDSPAIRLLARSAFQRAGWQPTEFEDLHSVQGALAEGPAPAAVVLDVYLPDGNGLHHAREFVERGAAVIMLSNLAGPEQVEQAFAAGAIDIVAKPLDMRSLVARVARAVDQASGTDRLGDGNAVGPSYSPATNGTATLEAI